MKRVNSRELALQSENLRYNIAKSCEHYALDTNPAPMLWHRSFCLHPDRPDPITAGRYEHCDLVWKGTCPYGYAAEKGLANG